MNMGEVAQEEYTYNKGVYKWERKDKNQVYMVQAPVKVLKLEGTNSELPL